MSYVKVLFTIVWIYWSLCLLDRKVFSCVLWLAMRSGYTINFILWNPSSIILENYYKTKYSPITCLLIMANLGLWGSSATNFNSEVNLNDRTNNLMTN